ncbi:MAG: hypothetical protein ACRD5L_02180 [Bryobacteraceae bacterium]
MRRFRMRGLRFALFGLLIVAVVSVVVMGLWNWLTPALFGWKTITYWQALGLLVLSRILLGGLFRGRPGHGMHWRHRMKQRWEQMSPEEREKFRQGMRGRCGQSPSSPAASVPPASV